MYEVVQNICKSECPLLAGSDYVHFDLQKIHCFLLTFSRLVEHPVFSFFHFNRAYPNPAQRCQVFHQGLKIVHRHGGWRVPFFDGFYIHDKDYGFLLQKYSVIIAMNELASVKNKIFTWASFNLNKYKLLLYINWLYRYLCKFVRNFALKATIKPLNYN